MEVFHVHGYQKKKKKKKKIYSPNLHTKLKSIKNHAMDGYQKVDPGAAVTKSPPPVIFCQVGVSHIYVTESQPPVIFMPT